MVLLLFGLIHHVASVSAAPLPPSPPLISEVERDLADNYQARVLTILHAIDDHASFDVLVKVTLPEGTPLDQLTAIENTTDEYLPGTLKVDGEQRAKDRLRIESRLPQTREVLIIGPDQTSANVRESLLRWVTQELKLGAKEQIRFEERPTLSKPESHRPYLLAIIGALALVAAAGLLGLLLLLNRSSTAEPRVDPPASAAPHDPPIQALDPGGAEAASENEPGSRVEIEAVLNQIRRMSVAYPDAASAALGHLINRDDLIGITANVVSALGMDSALTHFPRVSPASWSRLGDALANETSTGAMSLEKYQIFVRALNGEMARAQRKMQEIRMLPTLEKQNSATITSRINGLGTQQGATMLALLSEPAMNEVVPLIAKKDLAPMLTQMLSITSIAREQIAQFDQAGEDAASTANVAIESVAKVATALATLPAGEELALFDTLNQRSGGRLLAEIASHRLYPAHLPYLPKDVLATAIQDRDFETLRRLTQSRPEQAAYVLKYVSDRQRQALEDSAGELTDGASAWRSLCDDLYARVVRTMGSAQLTALFAQRKVS